MTQRPPHFYDKVFAGRTGNDQALQVQGDLTVTKTDGTVVMTVDASVPTITFDTMDLYLGDSDFLAFGDAQDITMTWDGTSLKVAQATANSAIQLGVDGAGIDVIFEGDTASATMTWDQSADSLIFSDSVKAVFGTGSDITMAWDGTDFDILQAAANSSIKFGVDGAGIDVVMYGDTASASMTWDQSADSLTMAGAAKLGTHRRLVTSGQTGSVSVAAADSGTIFVSGAGATTFTLPALAAGLVYEFFHTHASNLVITSPGDNMIVKNDTCTTVTFSTGGEQIGASVRVFCDGTNYFMQDLSPEAWTMTLS